MPLPLVELNWSLLEMLTLRRRPRGEAANCHACVISNYLDNKRS